MRRNICAILLVFILLLSGCATTMVGVFVISYPEGRKLEPVSEPEDQPEPAPVPEPEPPAPPEPTVATLAVCGDAMSHMPLTNDAWNGEKNAYDYVRIMSAVQPIVSGADYAVVNLETTLAGGPPYSGYPCFNSPDDLAYGLKEIGFDLCLTANNHSLDKGFSGLSRTLDVLDEVGLAHVGTSRTQEEYDYNIALADVGGISVAFLGYTYGTNGIPVHKDHPYSINLFNTDYLTNLSALDTEKLSADLAAAEALNPDLIAVMIHWGVEYKTTENSYQDKIADFLFEHGADIVLGGHSHVLQPMGLRTISDGDGESHQGFVCYSLGNFISSQNYELTDTTVALELELTRNNETGKTEVTGYSYSPMFMLDREEGASPRFELVDAHAALEAGTAGEGLQKQLTKAIENCHAILGAEYDSKAFGDYLAQMPELSKAGTETQ